MRRLRDDATASTFTTITSMAIVLIAAVPAATLTEPERRLSREQLSALIATVRAETDADKQELIARQLPQLVDGAELDNIDAKTVEDLAALLNTLNDEARRWVAITLGLFERRAYFTLPKLRALYQDAYCARLRGESGSESLDAVRFAIQSIDGIAPVAAVCLLKIQIPEGA